MKIPADGDAGLDAQEFCAGQQVARQHWRRSQQFFCAGDIYAAGKVAGAAAIFNARRNCCRCFQQRLTRSGFFAGRALQDDYGGKCLQLDERVAVGDAEVSRVCVESADMLHWRLAFNHRAGPAAQLGAQAQQGLRGKFPGIETGI